MVVLQKTKKPAKKIKAPQASRASGYENTLVEAIELGFWDDHLRTIVRACFERRQVLDPKAGYGIVQVPKDVTAESQTEVGDTANDTAPSDTATKLADGTEGLGPLYVAPSGTHLPNDRPTVSMVQPRLRVASTECFKRFGRRYYKTDLVGRTFHYPDTCAPKYLHGSVMEIVDVSDVGRLVLKVCVPSRFSKRAVKAHQDGTKFSAANKFVDRFLLNHYNPANP